MVEISFVGDNAIFEIVGMDKVWALKSRIEVPLAHIAGAFIDRDAARGWWHGLRMPGTQIPGVITAGTFYQHGSRAFYDVHDADNTIIVQLKDDRYEHLIIEVAHPEAEVSKITSVVSSRQS